MCLSQHPEYRDFVIFETAMLVRGAGARLEILLTLSV